MRGKATGKPLAFRMPKLAAVLFVALCAAPAHAEIFKCANKAGAVAYQNFPCHLDSIGSSQTTQPPKVASAEPKVGMTAEQVTSIWGEPADRYEDEQSKGRYRVWEYGGSRSVRFDHKHRVVAVQR
jgi:hypothetical protein